MRVFLLWFSLLAAVSAVAGCKKAEESAGPIEAASDPAPVKPTVHKPAPPKPVEARPDLALLSDGVVLKVGVLTTNRRPVVKGETNLPDGTGLIVEVTRKSGGGFPIQADATVQNGRFSTRPLSSDKGLEDGVYVAEVTMPIPSVQPRSVQGIVGTEGQHLKGPLVVRNEDGDVYIELKREFHIGSDKKTAMAAETDRAKEVATVSRMLRKRALVIVLRRERTRISGTTPCRRGVPPRPSDETSLLLDRVSLPNSQNDDQGPMQKLSSDQAKEATREQQLQYLANVALNSTGGAAAHNARALRHKGLGERTDFVDALVELFESDPSRLLVGFLPELSEMLLNSGAEALVDKIAEKARVALDAGQLECWDAQFIGPWLEERSRPDETE